MAYIKYKEIAKYFYFSKVKPVNDLPNYVLDYVFSDELILVAYKTFRDHGVFTTEKIVLFDNRLGFDQRREIVIIPYKNITSISIIFHQSSVELSCGLNSGYPLRIKFVKMSGIDKKRIRLLYCAISKIINDQKLTKEEILTLVNDDISFAREDGKNGKK